MRYTLGIATALLIGVLLAALGPGCHQSSVDAGGSDSDSDSDGDSDGDSDTDSDGDTDTDADSDGDGGTDTETWTDTDCTPVIDGVAGPNAPAVGENLDTIGTRAWDGYTNVSVEDASDTSPSTGAARVSAMINSEVSNYLVARDFGFDLPDEATITGLTVEVRRRALSAVGLVDNELRTYLDGTLGTTNQALAGEWTNSYTYFTYGGDDDLWGESWTPAQINDPLFGVALSVLYDNTAGNDHPYVDHVRVSVHYDVVCW